MQYRSIVYFVICFFLFPYTLFSQKPYLPDYGDPMEEPWRWAVFDELSGKGVQCIAESLEGNIWFGINKGLIRYNGIEWKEFTSKNGFTGGTVYHIVRSGNQKIYAGTNQGLYVFNNDKWEKIFPANHHPKNNSLQKINCLKSLRDGGIIASVGDGHYCGLLSITDHDTSFMVSKSTHDSLGTINGFNIHIVPDDKCIDNIFYVEEIFQDSQNRIWLWLSMGTEIGNAFYYYHPKDNNSIIQYSKNFTSSDGLIKGVRARYGKDKQGNIWMVNNEFNKGVSIFDGTKWRYYKSKGENSHLSISNINDVLWIGGFGILYSYDSGKWKKYQKPVTAIVWGIPGR